MLWRIVKWGNLVEVYLVEGETEQEAFQNYDEGKYELVHSNFEDTDTTIEKYDK